MVDILRMGSNSLLSLQQALNTTGHNIANVNTEGYSRQSVEFGTVGAQNYGFGYLGQGAKIEDISRSYDRFLTKQVTDFTSSQSRYETFVNFSSRVDNILANSENSLNTSLQGFFNALSDVASSPSSLPERQVLLGQARNLVDRQQTFSHLLQSLNNELNTELNLAVDEINVLTNNLSKLNKEIVSAIANSNGATPNDLLDRRDILIRELSSKVSVTTIPQDDGAMNVFIGTGQAIVLGSKNIALQTQLNPYDSSRLEIGIAGQFNVNGYSDLIKGGELEGLLDFRNRVLIPAQSQLGLIVSGLTETVNAQHQAGMDMDGGKGGDFFQVINPSVAGHVSNAGTVSPSVTITDVTNLRASDYLLSYDGSQWQATRRSDNTTVSGAGPLLSLDGMSIDVSTGTASAGDSFIFNPARTAASNFSLAITDPRKIAAAELTTAEPASSNLGTAELSGLTVASNNTLPLATPITLTFNPDALGVGVPGFDVVGGPVATLAYDPASEGSGKTFNFSTLGISFSISDTPQVNDSFSITNNTGASGDNRNALKLGDLQYQATLNGGKESYQEFYGSLVAQVGVNNNQANANLSIETVLLQQAQNYRDGASGVNLDEEAANLIRYQQSYQASAQLVKIADELFQTLINSIS